MHAPPTMRPSTLRSLCILFTLLTLTASLPASHPPSSIACPCTLHLHRHKTHPNLPISLLLHSQSSLQPFSILNETLPPSQTNPFFNSLTLKIPHRTTLSISLLAEHVSLRAISRRSGIDTPTCPVVIPNDPPVTRPQVRATRVTPRIVGGNFASPNLVPYMVAIHHPDGRYCTGTMISEFWGITAAHCRLNTSFAVELMSTQVLADRTPSDGVRRTLLKVINHPQYAVTGLPRQNDIAVFRLNQSVPGVKYATINADMRRPAMPEHVRIVGFGHISYQQVLIDPSPGSLRQVDIPIVDHDVCRDVYIAWELVSKQKQICAGYYSTGGCDSCSGDSGGPMFQYDSSGKPVVMGIVSYGVECARPNFPGVYVRTAAFIKWLQRNRIPFKKAKWKRKISAPSSTPQATTPATATTMSTTTSTSASTSTSTSATTSASSPTQTGTRAPNPSTLGGGETQVSCRAGQKVQGKRCINCHKKSISSGGIGAKCVRCSNNMYRHPLDGNMCACVGRHAIGKGMLNGACAGCRPGYFAGMRNNVCRPCAAGSYSNEFGSGECKLCPTGMTSEKRSKKCVKIGMLRMEVRGGVDTVDTARRR